MAAVRLDSLEIFPSVGSQFQAQGVLWGGQILVTFKLVFICSQILLILWFSIFEALDVNG